MALASSDRARSTHLADCLRLPEMAGSRVRVWPAGVDAPINWIAVIEWPVEDFVSQNDLVLTTGIGCDEAQLCDMIRQIAASGATGVCICTGQGAFHEVVGDAVVAAAKAGGIALIEIPWRTRFSDICRAVIGALYTEDGEMGGLPEAFTVPLLGSSGVDGVAAALETAVGAPAAILDATLRRAGAGALGREWLADGNTELELVEALSAYANCPDAVDSPGAVDLRLASGRGCVVRPVVASSGALGWLVLARVSSPEYEDVAPAALTYAATATAIELLRKAAEDQAESRGREQFLWEIARGSIDSLHELAARAGLLGLPVGTEYTVGVGLIEPLADAIPGAAALRAAVGRLRGELSHPHSLVAVSDREILLCACGEQDTRTALNGALPNRVGRYAVTFGYAAGRHKLTGLAQAVAQARQVLGIVRTLHGLGASGRAEDLQVYLLLQRLVDDPAACELIDKTLGPLEQADKARNSQLLQTLTTYLDAGANIASAARALYLNRHSLMYRLRKISELTGLDVNDPHQRLMLDMTVKLRRLQAWDAQVR